MNYDSNKHVIEYIEGNKVKQFKVPKDDYNLKFDKMSYNDVLMYIKLTKEEQDKSKQSLGSKQKNVIKYKPLKTAFAKTKDYFAQDIKLMTQAEKLKKVAEYLISNNIQELKEFLSNDVFNDDPIIKSVMELLNHKGYTNDEIKDLMKRKDDINLYTSEIENCIIKDGDKYSFKNITFKNTLGDLVNLSHQVGILERYTIYVPINNPLVRDFKRKIDFDNKQNGFTQLKDLIFGKGSNFTKTEGRQVSSFLSDNYFTPSIHYNYIKKFILTIDDYNKGWFTIDVKELKTKKELNLPLYFYSLFNNKIYLNLKILYYLLQFNESFKNNNYRFVVETLKNGITSNIILIAGSAFDLDNILNSLDEDNKDESTDYYIKYVNLMTDTISKFFNKQFTPVVKVTSVDEPLYYSDIEQDLTDDEKTVSNDNFDEDVKTVEPVSTTDVNNTDINNTDINNTDINNTDINNTDINNTDVDDEASINEYLHRNRIERLKELSNDKNPAYILEGIDELKNNKKAKGIGLFSFRKDTKETLQSLLNRVVKLESAISYQNEQIKQLKTGIKSINQALPSSIRKDVFGNYFSNSLSDSSVSSEDRQSPNSLVGEQVHQSEQVYQSNYNIGGALNPDKVYPKITFSEFRKLYNKLDSK